MTQIVLNQFAKFMLSNIEDIGTDILWERITDVTINVKELQR